MRWPVYARLECCLKCLKVVWSTLKEKPGNERKIFVVEHTNRLLSRCVSESSDISSGMTPQRSVISVAERARLGWLNER